jgi:oligopeptide transport system substrate-binding protein
MRKNILPGLCLSLLVFIISCGPKHEAEENIFRYNEMGDVTSLDPAAARSFENIWVDNQIYNGLVQMGDSFHIKPCIAKSWDITNNGTIYTFHLRTDVYFQDDSIFPQGKGRQVVANDFVHSFFRLFDGRVSDATTLLNDVDRTYPGTIQGLSASNDSTFIIYLKKPYAPFMNILTMKYFSVVAIEAVDKFGLDFGEHPVGTGPFKLKNWVHGNKMVLAKNSHYFEKDAQGSPLPYLDGVVISFIKDMETSFLSFIDGKFDMVSGISAINTKQVFSSTGEMRKEFKDKFYLQRVPFLKTDYLGFMIDPTHLRDKNIVTTNATIRKAINYAINKEDLVRYLRYNVGIPAINGFIPPILIGNKNMKTVGYDYDPDKANALLNEAGYPNGKGLPEINIYIPDDFSPIAQHIQQQLQQIGLKVNIQRERPAVLAECVVSGQCYFFKKSWVGDYPDAENFLSLFYSKNFTPEGVNFFHYSNPKFDTLYEHSLAESNDSIRNAEYGEMDKLVMDEAPVVALYYDEVIRLVNKNISGLPIDPRNSLDLRFVKKKLPE